MSEFSNDLVNLSLEIERGIDGIKDCYGFMRFPIEGVNLQRNLNTIETAFLFKKTMKNFFDNFILKRSVETSKFEVSFSGRLLILTAKIKIS